MRIYAARSLFLFVHLLPVQPCHSAYSTVPDRTYQLLREDEDWSFLRNPALRTDFWDPIKYVPLHRKNWYLSFGGEVRLVWEHVGNDNWGQQPYWNSFFLQRYMPHVDARLGKHFRAFVQLKSGIETFRQGWPQTHRREAPGL